MKKPYQIESQRAVNRLEELALEGNPAVQMLLLMAEVVGRLHKGVGELRRQAGLQLIQLLMEEEVKHPVGERSQRWGGSNSQSVGKRARILHRNEPEGSHRTSACPLERGPGSPVGQL